MQKVYILIYKVIKCLMFSLLLRQMTKYLILVLFYENRTCHLRSVMEELSGYRGMMAMKELVAAMFLLLHLSF